MADLNTDDAADLAYMQTQLGMDRRVWGLDNIRKTRMKVAALRAGVSGVQLKIGVFGDSYTQRHERYIQKFATRVNTLFGFAAGGWVGFGFPSSDLNTINGNARRDLVTCTRSGTGWSSNYIASISPDICDARSSVAGDKITVGIPAGHTSCRLIYGGTTSNQGTARYRWDGGAWTAFTLSGSEPSYLDLTGMPSTATTLDIEVTGTNTCRFKGLILGSATSGAIVNKLAASGAKLADAVSAINGVSNSAMRTYTGMLDCDVFVGMYGPNDQGASRTPEQFYADYLTWIDAVRTIEPDADVLIIAPPENQRTTNTYPMASYTAAALAAAKARSVGIYDCQFDFGVLSSSYAFASNRPWFSSDLLHPSDNDGGSILANCIWSALFDRVTS